MKATSNIGDLPSLEPKHNKSEEIKCKLKPSRSGNPSKYFCVGGWKEYLVCLWVGVNKTSWLGSEPSHYPEHLLT